MKKTLKRFKIDEAKICVSVSVCAELGVKGVFVTPRTLKKFNIKRQKSVCVCLCVGLGVKGVFLAPKTFLVFYLASKYLILRLETFTKCAVSINIDIYLFVSINWYRSKIGVGL